jgi:hypothetical protein
MPMFISTKASKGVCMLKKLRVSSPLATRIMARPARIIMPATMPPKNRYSGISQLHAVRYGSMRWLCLVEVISSMAAAPQVR